MLEDAGFASIEQTTSTYPFLFGKDKEFQFLVGTMLVKDKLNEMGDDAWKKAREGWEGNVMKYATIEPDGTLMLPKNTFRLTLARK